MDAMNRAYRQSFGQWGEQEAASFLVRKGYQLIEQNARTAYGEIDLIVRLGTDLIFVEVKTRRTREFGFPEEALTGVKRAHLMAAAQAYLQAHPELESSAGGQWRIDVISILIRKEGPPEVLHFENAVT